MFRVLFDNLSLFLECALLVDEAPPKLNARSKRATKLAEIKEQQAASSDNGSVFSEVEDLPFSELSTIRKKSRSVYVHSLNRLRK